ncbi:MAG: NAD+ synthase [Actinomycetota bacterium]
MPAVRLAMAQINPTVGDLAGNAKLILSAASEAAKAGANLVVFPELALSGYPIEDLALSEDFLEACELELQSLAINLDILPGVAVVVGHPAKSTTLSPWAKGQNCASVLRDGQIIGRYAKHHLPNYSVFDEYRVFVPGNELVTFVHGGIKFAIAICEDIWQSGGPVGQIHNSGAITTLVLNGSPFEISKSDYRLELVQNLARNTNTSVVYVNLIGGQDDLVFDGHSFAVTKDGREILRSRQFEESISYLEIADEGELIPISESVKTEGRLDQIWSALVLGVRDYVRKNNFKTIALGLSGGIDSAVCATIAVDAVGSSNVFGFAMPSKFSSEHSISDAQKLASNLGIPFEILPIESLVESFEESLELSSLARENLQARVRGVILMAQSNTHGQLVLSTGNKSEIAVGYSTIYGDSVGGFAPLKDVEKTLVWELARNRNRSALNQGEIAPIPESSISKPPSAELREGQLDSDSLPDYEILDGILRGFIEEGRSIEELFELGYKEETVLRIISMVTSSEWKRRQGAIGPRITKLAFGRERRFPITNHFN